MERTEKHEKKKQNVWKILKGKVNKNLKMNFNKYLNVKVNQHYKKG